MKPGTKVIDSRKPERIGVLCSINKYQAVMFVDKKPVRFDNRYLKLAYPNLRHGRVKPVDR